MRRRLMTLVFVSTLFALMLLGVILISFIWAAMGTATQDRAQATARVAAAAIDGSYAAGAVVSSQGLEEFVRDSATLTATLPDVSTISAGPPIEGDAYTASATSGPFTVVAAIPRSFNVARITYQGSIVVGISVVALAISTLVAHFYARRITRPLEDFGEVAARIGTGDRRLLSRRYGVPELDAVADVLDRGVATLHTLLENERRVTNEASHQLRTPLTALSLRLEEILATDDLDVVRSEATAALGQVERLSGVIDEVVALSRGQLPEVAPVDVDELVGGQLTEWAPAYAAVGRGIRRLGMTGLVVAAVPGAQAQALATLVENSLVHGRGVTTVRIRPAGDWVVLEVSDEGPGIPEELGSRVFERSVSGASSSGLGLALARTIVAADGGRLELLSARPAVFGMFLHAYEVEPVEPVEREPLEREPVEPMARVEGQALVEIAAASAASASSGNTQRR